jgi:hypothetical protein
VTSMNDLAPEVLAKAIEIADREVAAMREEKEIPGIAFGLMFNGELVYPEYQVFRHQHIAQYADP